MYINTETMAYPVYESQIKAEYPNTSFPKPFVAPAPYAPVLNSPQPTYNQVLQIVREVTPVKQGTNWMQQWEVADKYQDYTDDEGVFHSKAEQEAEAIAKDEADKKAAVKAQAEKLLQETDWAEVPSVSNTSLTPHLANYSEFITYRLAIRAIAVNPPVTVDTWPTKPVEVWN